MSEHLVYDHLNLDDFILEYLVYLELAETQALLKDSTMAASQAIWSILRFVQCKHWASVCVIHRAAADTLLSWLPFGLPECVSIDLSKLQKDPTLLSRGFCCRYPPTPLRKGQSIVAADTSVGRLR